MTSLNTVAAALPMSFYVQASGVLAGCKLHTYVAGTTTPQATYQDYAGSTPNSNPITLDSNGSATIRYLPNTGYKLVLNDPTDTTTLASLDNFYAPQAGGGALYVGTDSGSANTYTVTIPGTLLAGLRIWFEPANANTGASTINGTAIKTPNGSALVGGELPANQPAEFYYDGTNFVMLSLPFYTGSYTGTLTGCTTSPTGSVIYMRHGYQATLFVPSITATSNTTGATITGSLPAGLQPQRTVQALYLIEDNSSAAVGAIQLAAASSVLTLLKQGAPWSATFTNSGTKGALGGCISYPLN